MMSVALAAGGDIASEFFSATVRFATPLAFAALGECVSERAGVINIGLEGAIIAGALGGTVGAGIAGPAVGFAVGAAAGVLVACVFTLFTVWMRADQIITGTATNLPAAYRDEVKLITVTVTWTNYTGKNKIVHTRSMQTYSAYDGIQNYIYGSNSQ